jgi:uncharacterized protein YdhG (YjbR/CyaY superfamily)
LIPVARPISGERFAMEEVKGHPKTVDEYISQYPKDIRQILEKITAVVKESAPGAVEKIGYNMPAYDLNGFLVSFSVWKRHIGFYPRHSEMEASIVGLSAYKGTKGSVHFPLDQPMPYEMIREIVKFRVAENLKG